MPEIITSNMETLLPTAISMGTKVLLALAILIIGYWVAGTVHKFIKRQATKSENIDDTLGNFLGSIAKYVILAFTFIAVLGNFGIETTAIIGVFSAATLAVGLALQGSLGNLAAGVMLMIFRPFKIGQLVEVAGKTGGVEEINLFTTILRTLDHQQIIIPNGKVWGEQIVNHSHHAVRGVEMTFGISYDADIDKAKAVIADVFAKNEFVLSDPAPGIVVSELNDSSVDIAVRPFVQADHWLNARFSLPEQVKKALDANGIDIPYPHTKVVMAKD